LSKYYLNITELPLKNFIDCIVNNNIYALIISGHPDVNDLYVQWHEISQQYADAIGDNDHRMYAIMLRNYTVACANYELVQRGVQILKIVHHPEICDKINKILGTSLLASLLSEMSCTSGKGNILSLSVFDSKEAAIKAASKAA
jgi:hypothetical protein